MKDVVVVLEYYADDYPQVRIVDLSKLDSSDDDELGYKDAVLAALDGDGTWEADYWQVRLSKNEEVWKNNLGEVNIVGNVTLYME